MRKISMLICLLFSVFFGKAQCNLSVIDTTHINCNGDALGGFVLDVGGAISPYTIYLNNGITQVDNSVFNSKSSKVWLQASNRVHVQKSILLYCFGKLR